MCTQGFCTGGVLAIASIKVNSFDLFYRRLVEPTQLAEGLFQRVIDLEFS